jgi:hypothetical protein
LDTKLWAMKFSKHGVATLRELKALAQIFCTVEYANRV